MRFALVAAGVLLLAPLAAAQSVAPSPYVPQTAADRARQWAGEAVLDPGLFFGSAMGAGIQQWRHRPEEWPLGAAGYGRRLGFSIATQETQVALHHGLAAALGEDSRYESCLCRGASRRLKFALSQVFLTRNRAGARVPRYSLLAGYFGGAAIATQWYPESYRNWGRAATVGSYSVGFEAFAVVYREFRPEIRRLLRRK